MADGWQPGRPRCGQLPTPGVPRNALRRRSGPSRPKVGTIEQDDNAWLERAARTEQEDRLDNHDQEWGRKGATLSDKTARKEYGLTEDEIIDAINAGSLDYRVGSVYGTPWFRLLRREVEHLVEVRRGRRYLDERRAKAELAKVDADLTRLRGEVAVLEERRSKLLAELPG